MDSMLARPQTLKQVNLSLLRRVIRQRGSVTRAELALETNISSTTVRSLLTEMLENGELERQGYDQSSGGRKAERYSLRPDRYCAAAFCISREDIQWLLVDLQGSILEQGRLEPGGETLCEAVAAQLDVLTTRREIRAVGLGVPGVVEAGGYLYKDRAGRLHRSEIGDLLAQRYGLPVVLENDLNAMAIGFGRRYQRECGDQSVTPANMALLYFEPDCISAGFIVDGRVIRGYNNYAGELGMVPGTDGRPVERLLGMNASDQEYTQQAAQALGWVGAILNPQYAVLGGPGFRPHCLAAIRDKLSGMLPRRMAMELLPAQRMQDDYCEGMAWLAAGRILDDVQLLKR